jgi:hypothetical protein
MFLNATPEQYLNLKPKATPITYDVMLTFDLKGASDSEQKAVKKKLKDELGFKTNWQEFDCDFIKDESESVDEKHKLPENTYLSKKFSGTDYVSKKELAEFLRDELKKILNGKFVFLIDDAKDKEINGYAE